MAKKKKSAEDIIYEIKDLLDDLELKINPDDAHVAYEDELDDELDEDEDFDLDEDEDEDKD
jgi:hypothetical protein